MMDDLVLRSRLDTLRRTLEQVRSLRSSLLTAREELDDLEKKLAPTQPDSIRTDTGEVLDKLATSIRRIEDLDLDDTRILTDLNVAENKAEQVRKQARSAHAIVKSLQRRWVDIDDGRIGPTLDSYMINVAGKCANEVTREEKALAQAAGEDAVRKVWAEFQGILSGESEPLFNEYVDLLGGLALRTVGFGHEVCQRADVLLKLLLQRSSGPKWDSLAVPAHTEALQMTPAQIIRLGFPGWTIWELPLAAHDFGHAVAASLPAVQAELKQETWGDYGGRFLNTLFADAFAAYAMGPAYACAAVLLRLDPSGSADGRRERPPDVVRARMTLSTLRAIDEASTYAHIVDELEEQWSAAVRQVGQGGTSTAHDQLVDAWHDKVVDLLRGETPNAEYKASHWNGVSHWVATMRSGSVPAPAPEADVRDVLNAAWQTRIQDLPSTESITEIALKLWDVVTGTLPDAGGREQPGAATPKPKS